MQGLNVEPIKLISLLEAVANFSPDPKRVSEAVTLRYALQLQSGTPVQGLAWCMPAAA